MIFRRHRRGRPYALAGITLKVTRDPLNRYIESTPVVLQPLNDWLGLMFARRSVGRTIAALAPPQGGVDRTADAREG